DRRAGLEGQEDRSLFRDITGSARPIDGKCGIRSLANQSNHFRERSQTAARTGAASGAVTETLDALRDRLAVESHARHDNDSAISPIVCRWKNPAVPEGENGAFSAVKDFVQMGVANGLPSHGSADEVNNNVADPTNYVDFKPLNSRERHRTAQVSS